MFCTVLINCYGVTFLEFLHLDSIDPVHAFVCITTAIVSSSLIPCSVLLLHAVFNNYRPILLVPWLVLDIAIRCIHATILISGIHLAATSAVSHGVATVFFMTCAISIRLLSCREFHWYLHFFSHLGLETYLWWIVLCYYRELRKHETICRGAAQAELVAM